MQFNVKQPQKKFNPITVELTFESQEELNWFYWITDTSLPTVEENVKAPVPTCDYQDIQMQFYAFADRLHKQHSS